MGQQLPYAALGGMATRAKIEVLQRYWFDTGHLLVVELIASSTTGCPLTPARGLILRIIR
jgi:hypothetical protein